MTPEQARNAISDFYGITERKEKWEALDLATAALSKQIALPPKTEDGDHYCCPNCGQYWGKIRPYCYMCGQRIGEK